MPKWPKLRVADCFRRFFHLYTVEAETVTLCNVTGLQDLLVAPEASILVQGDTMGSCDPVFSHPTPACSYEPLGGHMSPRLLI